MEPLLSARNISKYYDLGDERITALNDINLDVYPGEFVAIVGKSGSGKSTLMHILGLLDSPSSGQVILNGIDVTQYKEKELARMRNQEIGFVFQFFNLLPRTTTTDNVMLPLKYSKVPRTEWKQRATDMLIKVGLANRLNNKSNELSGGQKQRVAIARALVNEPSIIFADEPTGNLDSKTGDEIVAFFKELNAQGKTIILVTHDDDLAKVAKRQIILKDGSIIS